MAVNLSSEAFGKFSKIKILAINSYYMVHTYMCVCVFSVISCYSTSPLGGAYIPPARLRMMQQQITDKNRYVMDHVILFITLATPPPCSAVNLINAWLGRR